MDCLGTGRVFQYGQGREEKDDVRERRESGVGKRSSADVPDKYQTLSSSALGELILTTPTMESP